MAEQVNTQVAGNVWKVLVKPGDEIKAGDVLFILELMKMEVPHAAETDGRISAVTISEGETVEADQPAVTIA
jgi:biotin carboxyl carrier protein